jgi:hypothetical protein
VYGAFADAEFLGGGTDSCPVLYDVKSQALGPVFHVFLQSLHSPPCGVAFYAAAGAGMPKSGKRCSLCGKKGRSRQDNDYFF